MKILGIDPGLEITGYGIVEHKQSQPSVIEAGVIKTSHKDPLPKRLNALFLQISELLDTYKPDVAVIEELYSHYKHPMTALLMGHARGVVLYCCSQYACEIVSYPAKTPKRAVTGNGNATKAQVQRVVNRILNLKDHKHPFDVTDALALCLAYIYHTKTNLEPLKV